MSLNPPMYTEVTPMSKVGELFLLQRPGLSFEVETDGLPKLKASSGILFLTTTRMVFVNQNGTLDQNGIFGPELYF